MASLNNKTPGLPAVENLEYMERLYTLKSTRGGDTREQLLLFDTNYPVDQVIDKCKEYCHRNGRRFQWAAKAITKIE